MLSQYNSNSINRRFFFCVFQMKQIKKEEKYSNKRIEKRKLKAYEIAEHTIQ